MYYGHTFLEKSVTIKDTMRLSKMLELSKYVWQIFMFDFNLLC